MSKIPHTVDEYLESLPVDVKDTLENLRSIIAYTAPKATQRIAYRVPIFALEHDLVGFSAQKNPKKKLCSLYTMSPALVKTMKADLKNCKVSGATIHFTPDKPLPKSLVRKIVRARIRELKKSK